MKRWQINEDALYVYTFCVVNNANVAVYMLLDIPDYELHPAAILFRFTLAKLIPLGPPFMHNLYV